MPSVLTQVTWIVIGYGALVSILAITAALRWRARPPWLGSMVWMLEFLAVVLVLTGAGALLAGGDRPESMSTHVGYLVASVCVLPIAMKSVEDDEGVWAVGVIAIAAIAVTVIAVRLLFTA